MKANRRLAPYGTWDSPFSPSEVASQVRLQDVQVDSHSETLVWLEERSDRRVLVAREQKSAGQRDLTRELSVKARISYGGGDFCVLDRLVYFVSGNVIYRQRLDSTEATAVVFLDGKIASPTVSPDGKWLLFVRSQNRTDTLELVSTIDAREPTVLAEGNDFYMQPCWHPSELKVAWIAWNHPNMPWDCSSLFMAELEEKAGTLQVSSIRQTAEDSVVAHFQPVFSPDGRFLSVVSDGSGWFNLKILSSKSFELEAQVTEEAEHGSAAWIQGMRTYAWTQDGSAIFYLRLKEAFTQMAKFELDRKNTSTLAGSLGSYTHLIQPFHSALSDEIALIGSAPGIPPRVLSVSYDGDVTVRRRSSPEGIPPNFCSQPEKVNWPTGSGVCHGLYYPPTNPAFEDSGPPPAIIKIHGGPTSQFHADYALDTQFFTSRGYAVLAVNYRGSTGYGREYREALTGAWGVKDVDDIRSAAEFLVHRQLADRTRIVLMGGSAGGYTLLMCFVRFPGVFRAGICRYGVSDLRGLVRDTHKFEEHYLDSLIGTLPKDEEIYRERSPIFHTDKIRDPLAIFQGEEDQVVPKDQSDLIVESLRQREVPHLYRVYSGEGHGWRKQETIEDYYLTVDRFLRTHVLASSG
jgi:dipeptidyl aminopeptidase/acylaminoacyl peptidase